MSEWSDRCADIVCDPLHPIKSKSAFTSRSDVRRPGHAGKWSPAMSGKLSGSQNASRLLWSNSRHLSAMSPELTIAAALCRRSLSLLSWSQSCGRFVAALRIPRSGPVRVPSVRSMYSSTAGRADVQAAVVDLRSDTLTTPCARMRRAMAEAEVGDDVYGEDPTVNDIQRRAAQLFGTEDALFVISGCMANLIAAMCHCRDRGDEMLLGDESHMFVYEQGSAAQVAGIFTRAVRTLPDGRLDLQDLERQIQHGYPDVHYGRSRLICLENTHNRRGGRVLPLPYMQEVRDLADRYGMKIHLDGARLMNAAVVLGVEPAEIVQYCDSVSLCLSKGLGGPVGSLLGGKAEFVAEARRIRKLLGGAMRQAGVLAAPGLVALSLARETVTQDHQNARSFARGVEALCSPLCTVEAAIVESNMVLLSLRAGLTGEELCERLGTVASQEQQDGGGVVVKALVLCPQVVRLVWHRDISERDTQRALEKLTRVLQEYSTQEHHGEFPPPITSTPPL